MGHPGLQCHPGWTKMGVAGIIWGIPGAHFVFVCVLTILARIWGGFLFAERHAVHGSWMGCAERWELNRKVLVSRMERNGASKIYSAAYLGACVFVFLCVFV